MEPAKNRFLGRQPSPDDPRTLRVATYLALDLPPPPPACRLDLGLADWGIMGNNQYGNCVIACAAHAIMAWYHASVAITQKIPDKKVVDLSRTMGALGGYSILERNRYWQKNGMWSNQIHAYAAIEQTDAQAYRQAVYLFGVADIGLNLPTAWQLDNVWDVGTGRRYRPGSWGGHSVPIVGYDETRFYVVTWGQIQPITQAALLAYCDEAYALIDPAWLYRSGHAPNGLDLAALDADLAAVTH